jgi:hypothetical protein
MARSRRGDFGGGSEELTAQKLRGTVDLTEIEDRISILVGNERTLKDQLSELIVGHKSKKEIEEKRVQIIKIDGMITSLINLADCESKWSIK